MNLKKRLLDIPARLRGALISKQRKLPSMIRALHQLVPQRVLREVILTSPDRRQWGVLSAAWVGVSERELFTAAARVMGIEFEPRVPVPNLSDWGERARPILGELRRVGAVVVLADSTVVKIISIDPAEVRGLSFYKSGVSISLATWSDVAAALDVAERTIIETESNSTHHEVRQKRGICKKIIDLVVREAVAHGAQSVEIVSTAGRTRYQFFTSQGRYASGAIRPEVVSDLFEYLSSIGEGAIDTESKCSVSLRSLGSSSNFKLSWGANVRGMPEGDHDRVATSDLQSEACKQEKKDEAEAARTKESWAPVLVVDDNPMFCRVLERMLKREGMAPSFAEHGHAALAKLTSTEFLRPKLIICDLHMPVMNGRELLVKLKSDGRTKDIPIIILTSDDDAEIEMQLLADGADAFVPKAKDPRVLTAQAKRLLKSSVSREAA